ncbi:MAG: outer membrane protein assembly factor BamA [Verrucomicrobiota bacterium]
MKERSASATVRRPEGAHPLLLTLAPLAAALAFPMMVSAQALPDLNAPPAMEDASISPSSSNPVVKSIEIKFRGQATVDRERILSNMRLKVGEAYTKEKEEDDLRALYNTGDLLDVQLTTTQVTGGVKVTVLAEARAGLGEIEFSGNTVFNSERLRLEISLKTGQSIDDAKLAKAKQDILDVYKSKGYPDVTVNYSVVASATPGFSRAVFEINEGGRGIIRDVIFEGATSFSHGKLAAETKSDNRNWLKFWDLKRRVDREKIEADMKAIEQFYQNAGYLDAKVLGVEPRRVDDVKVDLVFIIAEGPVYTVAQVGVTGNKLYQTDQLIPVFQLEAGRTFSLADMKTDLGTIADYYGSRGYAESNVIPRIDKLKGNQLNITYAIEEGRQFKVGKINISGNQKTREEVIRRELVIAPTDEYNTIKISKSKSRLGPGNLDYFDSVEFDTVASDLGPDYKDININVKEKATGSVQFGAGFSSIDNLVGFAEVSQRNFDIANWPSLTGAGQRFRMRVQAGTKRKDFIMSFTEPYFMGERLSVGTDLFYTEKTYLSDYYSERDIGGNINLRKPLTENTYATLTYTLQNVEIYDVDKGDNVEVKKGDFRSGDKGSGEYVNPQTRRRYMSDEVYKDDNGNYYRTGGGASPEIAQEEGDYLQSKLAAAWVFDNRDNLQSPTKGHKITFETDLSGTFLGGDVDTYSFNLSGQKYWKMPWNTILSVLGEVNTVDIAGDGERVPIFEREFLGGANNLRGFDYRDVGPKDSNGEPIGGNSAAWLTVEYTFPIIAKVRGAVFADIGFVNRDSWEFSAGDYNADVGFGIRVAIPRIGPIKLDYGIPVTTDEHNDGSGKFNFSMDYKF